MEPRLKLQKSRVVLLTALLDS